MKLHYYIPKPGFAKYVCYPDSFGRYSFAEHAEQRYASELPFYNLHLVMRGKGYVVDAGKEYELSAGSGFLYGIHQEQHYRADKKDPWDVYWVHFYGAGLHDLLMGLGDLAPWLFSFDRPDKVEQLMSRLLAAGECYESGNEPSLSVWLYEILLEVVQNTQRVGKTPEVHNREIIRRAADVIRERCSEPLTLEQMAGLTGFSPSYFSRLFHQIMGKPPVQYVTECRILAAKWLLVSGSMTVKEIAAQCGFAQPSYFIRTFKHHSGLTPMRFREMSCKPS